jgi:adenine-specific DNA-methyltransferase
MNKLSPEMPELQSMNITADNITKLKSLFPEAFNEDSVDFEVLKQLLGENVDDKEERYGLNWHGKRQARQLALTLPVEPYAHVKMKVLIGITPKIS